jgi:hypothetical protein
MHKWLFLIFLISSNSFAQDLPEHLTEMLNKSQEFFEIYNQKSPLEIEDGKYDDSELLLFAQIDQIQGLAIIFNKKEIKNTKIRMVELIIQSFKCEQLEAIARVGRSLELNKKQASVFFEVALEYKLGRTTAITFPSHQ